MQIETNFNVGDRVYFLHDNKVTSESIDYIDIVINKNTMFVQYVIKIDNINIYKKEEECYVNKEELLKSL